jgi:hypothetical protein
MKKEGFLLLFLLFLCVGCSDDNGPSGPIYVISPPAVTQTDGQYFRLKANGEDFPFDLTTPYDINQVQIVRTQTEFFLNVTMNAENVLRVIFDVNGKIISADYTPSGISGVGITYRNYPNFPGNYFNLQVLSNDTAKHRLKVAFSGNLYLSRNNLASETFEIDNCEFDLEYPEQSGVVSTMYTSGFLDNCSAKFNGVDWYATDETYGDFTTNDPYKIEIKLSSNTSPGSFDFTPSSTTNCIRLAKFNTLTLTYDYYDTTGSVAYTYKEFHGATYYTYVGTYSFTAVNPANPADVIQVTDGKYTCYLR